MESQRDLGLSAAAPVLRRVLEAAITLAGLALLTFALYKILPGSPFDEENALNPVVREQLERSWNLHAPWPEQLASYLSALVRGDLGTSIADRRPVSEIVVAGLSATLSLNILGLLSAFALGFVLAVGIAWRPDGRVARTMDALSVALISIPNLFLGPLLILIFAMKLDWFPAAFLESPAAFVLPVLTLCLRPAGSFARVLGGALIEIRGADYLRTAKAKGLGEIGVLVHHALRNCWVPVLAYIGPSVVWILSGSFLVETLFAVRGLGTAYVDAIGNRDLPVILGLTLFYGALMVFVSLMLDLLIRLADPRMQENA